MKHFIFGIVLLIVSTMAFAQHAGNRVSGTVKGKEAGGDTYPLLGASVYWQHSKISASTNELGEFTIQKPRQNDRLIIAFVGYTSDTIQDLTNDHLEIILEESNQLDEVLVVYRKKSIETEYLNPIAVKKVGEKELTKAACCNLSESFETNPTVDVSFTDAVTGARQIMMLGLAGPYTQITRENMPDVRGLSAIFGLTYIPGPWIESIQLIKGTGSVTNGFESVAGQINVELKRPQSMEKLYLNAFASQEGRLEANANLGHQFKNGWGTALLLHGSNNSVKHDGNGDGFADMPLLQQYILLNRWELNKENGLHFELGAKGTYIDNSGGQLDDGHAVVINPWQMHQLTKRLESWMKLGKVSEKKPYQSIGFQASGIFHDQLAEYGNNNYQGQQAGFYANLLFQGIFNNTNHKYVTGLSFQADNYVESLNENRFNRQEFVPGAFFEYTYTWLEKFNLVAGFRADYHNHFGAFYTPRLHVRYAPVEKTILRLSAGRGQRTANILSENIGLLASSRQIVIEGNNSSGPYGLNPEVAWNYGINLTQHFTLDYREGLLSLDFYRTDFENQVVIDLDRNPQQAVFYNLNGKSYSNSFQVQADYELFKRFDLRLAYRWFDVKTTFDGNLLRKPLISEHRAFINLAYETRKYLKFDYTLNWQGNKRIPSTVSNPDEYVLPEVSPSFFVMNFQISKAWQKLFEVYLGVENVLDYKQENPILASDQPFSPYFDGSMIWGPVFGRNIYVGLRYKIR
jgi:outer membrane receptor for ferrienterochelin and colicins